MIETRIKNHIPELFQKLESAVSRFVQTSAAEIGEAARAAMGGPRSGRLYGTHRASAPGEAPANRSGKYLSSIEVLKGASLEAMVGASVPYAPILEYGLNRPLWNKVLTEKLPTLEAKLDDEIAGL
jgi:phage gpG-like protein